MSDIALEAFSAHKRTERQAVLPPRKDDGCLIAIPEAERGEVLERAAILEFDAGLSKRDAERQAFGEWAQKQQAPRKQRKPPRRIKNR